MCVMSVNVCGKTCYVLPVLLAKLPPSTLPPGFRLRHSVGSGFEKSPVPRMACNLNQLQWQVGFLYRFFLSKLEPRFLWARHQNNHRFVSVQHHILVSSHQKKQCDFDDTPSTFNSLELTGLLDLLYILMYTRAGPLIWKWWNKIVIQLYNG